MRRRWLFFCAGAFSLCAWAQPYPSRPIHLVIPFSAGGLVDVPGRLIAAKLSEALGQPVVVDNKPGAGSTIGADSVAKAKPDGYTLMITSTTHVISANLYRRLPYDPFRDFAPVTKLGEGPYVLLVHPSLGAKTVADLISLARAQPGKIDYVSSGNGSSQHLVAALFCALAHVQLNHVPYKGSGQAMQDLAGGQVKLGFVGTPNALPHLKAGRLRALAVTTRKRSAELPDVPTLDEAGVPGYEATIWMGLFAPAGTSREILTRLETEVGRVLSQAAAKAQMAATGVEVSLSGAEEFGAFVRAESDKWGKVVRATGATVN
ncbi:MAG TPA: tripartite tricarboxylate transporter substrate binding protein [Burkholderiales bacterium]|jgi:tripartite-type tricarboxylate transporter receptor subunit TctC|nr:tripartite tricarboxylate transporter substrate binding protein [Burkholderiales bacterium]